MNEMKVNRMEGTRNWTSDVELIICFSAFWCGSILLILSLMHVIDFGCIDAGTCGPGQHSHIFPSLS